MELAIIIGVVVILFVVFILASYIKAPNRQGIDCFWFKKES